tara:strand:- start:2959 stop:5094 length:2136 start_codon:yes stop_codon:yes gene_type:complete
MRFLPLLLFPLFAAAQTGWVSISIQGDAYGGETTWLVRDSSDAIVAGSAPLQGEYPYVEAFLPLPVGNYTFTIYDSFGDGICCDFGEGWFSVNTCVLDTTVYDFSTSEQTIPFEVLACPPPIFGCMQAGAINYHPWANAPAPCDFPPAQCEEGYNNILVTVTPDTYASEISWDLVTVPDGEVVAEGSGYSIVGAPVVEAVCLPIGSEFRVDVYDAFGDGMCGSCYGGVDGSLLVSNLCGETLYYVGDTTQYEVVSSDTIMIDPCFPPIPQGCTDSWFTEYDPSAVIDDGSCETEVILGCTDPQAINFNEDANTLETEDNCDFTLTLTDGAGDGWFGSWIGVQQGDEIWGPITMHPNDGFEKEIQIPLYSGEAVNVMFFTQGNAETTASQCGFYFDGPNGVFMEGGTNPWSDAIKKFPFKYSGIPVCGDFCVPGIEGCTLSFACNYNPEANVDGDCTFPIEYYGCDNECINDTDGDGVCDELEVTGCQDPSAFNYDPAATDPDDCEPIVFGCTDPTMFNYNEEANTENGSCIPVIYGCMDPEAFNYDEDANTELDDSCITAVPGCMDPDAANYDSSANIPANEDCLYDAGCITGPGEPYWANDFCYSWVIEVDPYCCEVGWDAVCINQYEYCAGQVSSITSDVGQMTYFFPNPTQNIINVEAPTGTVITIYDASGRRLVETQDTRINLPSPGVYVIMANYQGRITKERIVRQ